MEVILRGGPDPSRIYWETSKLLHPEIHTAV